MDAIVTAGGIPQEGDPLYEYTQGASKAMLDIEGKPMIQWALDALSGTPKVGQVVVIGLPENAQAQLSCTKPLTYLPNQGGMLDNILAGAGKVVDLNPQADVILSVSSDIPAITPSIVEWMVKEIERSDKDVFYNVVTRAEMERRYPGSNRSYMRLKNMEVCGGDLTAFRAAIITSDKGDVLKELISARKNVFKQASIIGYITLFLLLTRQLTLEGVVQRASNALNIRAAALPCPYPEIAMDVDKPYQLEILRKDLQRQTSA